MRTVNIREVAQVVRSKNAGPFRLTLDILFKDRVIYEQVKQGGSVTAESVASLYRLPADRVTDFVWFDPGKALKVTLKRPVSSGAPRDSDIYGAQQHAPLLALTVTLPDGEADVVARARMLTI